jgi:arsenite methyltransferase
MSESNNQGFNLDEPSLISVLDELPFWSAPFGIKLLEKIVPKKNMAVLDIGFGTGFPIIELAMRLGDTCKIYGMDPWNAASDRAREKMRAYGIKNCEILPAETQYVASLPCNNDHIPLPDQTIDLVVSNNGLNNVADLDRTLSECGRIMKPGGQLVFTMNLDGTMVEFYNVMENVLAAHHLADAISAMHQHIYEKRRPLDEVLSLLRHTGFSIGSVDHDLFFYKFADGTALFRHFFIRLAFLDAWKKIVPVEKQESIFDEIEIRINEISNELGYFRLSVPFVVIGSTLNTK